MKAAKPSERVRSFKDLRILLDRNPLQASTVKVDASPKRIELEPDPEAEKQLFQQAMADVTPLCRKKRRIKKKIACKIPHSCDPDPEAETLKRLQTLVNKGEGFVVADTPEYMEGRGYQVNPEIIQRLHRGDFSIQAHIDLHGMNVIAAKEDFDRFLRRALKTGNRAVLIVHGRGLSSPNKAVLKTKVREWLTSGLWRKWVIAFSSARICDGGAGATYVLLRQRPFTRRYRKQTICRSTS